jgi:hypothetical protein
MQSLTFEIGNYRGRIAGFCIRGLLLAVLTAFGVMLADRPAQACGGTGKALYDCLATKLDYKASMIAGSRADPEAPIAVRALQTAASQLRAATNKAQALSAISQARSAISGAIQQAKAAGHGTPIWAQVTNTLAEAAALIQKKG